MLTRRRLTARLTRRPRAVASRFTASLSTAAIPPTCRVAVPQSCRRRSVARAHASHQRRSCARAPSSVSASAPTHPAAVTAANRSVRASKRAARATRSAPATIATVPAADTAPDVPGGTARKVSTVRGTPPTSVPISVAQVSAVAAAREPAAAAARSGSELCPAANRPRQHNANTPPFARTCVASRAPPLSTIPAVRRAFSALPACESSEESTKYRTRSAPHPQPAATAAVPTAEAATAPEVDSEPALRAASAMATAATAQGGAGKRIRHDVDGGGKRHAGDAVAEGVPRAERRRRRENARAARD